MPTRHQKTVATVGGTEWNTDHAVVPYAAQGSLYDAFDTTDTTDPLSPWTTLGTPTVHDINSTAKSQYYVKKNSAAGVALVGIYQSWAPSAGNWVETWLSGTNASLITGNYAFLFVGEAGGTGKFFTLGISPYTVLNSDTMSVYGYTNRTTFATDHISTNFYVHPPFGLRMIYNASNSIHCQYTWDGLHWRSFLIVGNAGFVPAIAGVGIDTNGTGNDMAATFDFFNNG